MAEETDIVEASIVCVGSFNPAIFSPAWFRLNDLITEGQLSAAQVTVIHPQISQFNIDHLRVSVEPGRMNITVTSDPVLLVADLCHKILGELLPHTPVQAIGVNYGEHWRLDTWERRVALGRALAPIEPWGEWGRSFRSDDKDRVAGLKSLTMIQPLPELAGSRQVTVEPSAAIADKYRGVRAEFNYHRETSPLANNAEFAVSVIENEFQAAINFAKENIQDLRNFASELEVK